MDVINVVVAFEDEFDIEIPDQKIKELVSVGGILWNILRKIYKTCLFR